MIQTHKLLTHITSLHLKTQETPSPPHRKNFKAYFVLFVYRLVEMCLEDVLLVPLEPEIKTFKPFTTKRNGSFFYSVKERKECQKSGGRKRRKKGITQMHNMGLCESFVGFSFSWNEARLYINYYSVIYRLIHEGRSILWEVIGWVSVR